VPFRSLQAVQIQNKINSFRRLRRTRNACKKLLSEARVLTQKDVDRLKQEGGHLEPERALNRAYKGAGGCCDLYARRIESRRSPISMGSELMYFAVMYSQLVMEMSLRGMVG
jgi:hypothetical protein